MANQVRHWRSVVTISIAAVCAGVALVAAPERGTGQGQAESLLQRGRNKEVVEGNLGEAIKIYQQVVAQYPGNHAVAAQAALLIAQCYEKLGSSQIDAARRAYGEVVSKYADQPDVVAQAKSRLAALGQGSASADIRTRRIAEDLSALAVSADGRSLAYIDPAGEIGLLDVRTGERRLLTRDAVLTKGSWPEGGAVFSPDGSQLAFGWDAGDGTLQLRTIATTRATAPGVVFRCNQEITWFQLSNWMPDGATVLAALLVRGGNGGTTIGTIGLADGHVRELKHFAGAWSAGSPRLSPDGRFVLYEWASQAESQARDIMILSVADQRESILVKGPASQPTWSPDGRTVVFRSNRRGTVDLWKQAVAEGRAQGEPELLRPGLGAVTLLGATRNGALFYNSTVSLRYAYTAALDPSTGIAAAPTRAADHVVAPGPVSWSPDQSTIAFLRPEPVRLVLRSTTTASEREIPLALERAAVNGWFPDGRSALITGMDGQGKFSVVRQYVDTAPRIEPLPTVGVQFLPRLVAPDGTAFYAVTGCSETGCAITRVDLASGATVDLFRTRTFVRSYALTRDGRRLAYIVFGAATDAADELYVVEVAGGQPRRVTDFQRPSFAFGGMTWAADGEHLLVVVSPSANGRKFEVRWISATDGQSRPTGVVMASVFNGLSLSPDGRRLGFDAGVPRVEPWVMENLLPAVRPGTK